MGEAPGSYSQATMTLGPASPPLSSWFHGKITREQAERLLYPPETGLFLVRESTNYPGDYTLCVSCEGKVEHYRIMYHASKLSIDEEVYFENLMQLVEVRGGAPAGGLSPPTLLNRPGNAGTQPDCNSTPTSVEHWLCARADLCPCMEGSTIPICSPAHKGSEHLSPD